MSTRANSLGDRDLLASILARVGAEISRQDEVCRVVKTGFGPAMDRPGVCPSGLARGCEHPTAGFSISTQPGMEPGSVWHVLEAS